MKVTGTLTLEDGTQVSKQWGRLPKYWKSQLLDLLPYGTATLGAVYSVSQS